METRLLFTVTVEDKFSALHSVRCADGTMEPLHGHDWRVRAQFSTATLDENGMVVDFLTAQHALREIATALNYRSLNDMPGDLGKNPTAEMVAAHFFERLVACDLSNVHRVEITEAPGCTAAFESPINS